MRSFLFFGVLLTVSACSGPMAIFPGGSLAGPEAPFTPDVVPDADVVIHLETRPADPYSVNVNAMVVDGALYIDPATDRNWYPYLLDDNNVRIRLPEVDTVFAAQAVAVTDPQTLSHFDPTRKIFRLSPR